MSEEPEVVTSAISRRNALKAAAAVGVGAAAFAGPQIGVLGAAPAYAAHCSPGKFTTTDSSDRNVDCGGQCGDVFRLHGITLEQGGITATVTDKACADDPIGDILTISGVPANVTCVIQAGLWNHPAPPGPFFDLPSASFNQNDFPCSSRYILRLVCAPTDCFS